MCHQSGGLVARLLEAGGIPTVAVGVFRGHMVRVKYPRAIVTRFDRGQTMGPPGDPATQRRVLAAALDLLRTATPGEIRSFEG